MAEQGESSVRRSWFRAEPGAEPSSLGRAIKLRRAELSLSRRELAEAAGLSYPYVAEIENGAKPGSANAREAIAEALGMRQHELLAWSEELATRARTPADGPPMASAPPRPASAPAAFRTPAADDLAYDDPFDVPAAPTAAPPPPPAAAPAAAAAQGVRDPVESLAARVADVLADADPDDAERALLLVLGEERVRAIVRDELRRARS
jgi:transcriptional regulator with XRE-family HTH domain